jgi:hypothetical protein
MFLPGGGHVDATNQRAAADLEVNARLIEEL